MLSCLMHIITPGHKYTLDSHRLNGVGQYIQFVEKHAAPGDHLAETCDGTTNEELLSVLIDRLSFLNNVVPCGHNINALVSVKRALLCLNKRTAERETRGVRGIRTR